LNILGDQIRARRLNLGLFQSQVAELIGVRSVTITNSSSWNKTRESCLSKSERFAPMCPPSTSDVFVLFHQPPRKKERMLEASRLKAEGFGHPVAEAKLHFISQYSIVHRIIKPVL
jgi:hypothetical protein